MSMHVDKLFLSGTCTLINRGGEWSFKSHVLLNFIDLTVSFLWAYAYMYKIM